MVKYLRIFSLRAAFNKYKTVRVNVMNMLAKKRMNVRFPKGCKKSETTARVPVNASSKSKTFAGGIILEPTDFEWIPDIRDFFLFE